VKSQTESASDGAFYPTKVKPASHGIGLHLITFPVDSNRTGIFSGHERLLVIQSSANWTDQETLQKSQVVL
jgi:hypothetical protein